MTRASNYHCSLKMAGNCHRDICVSCWILLHSGPLRIVHQNNFKIWMPEYDGNQTYTYAFGTGLIGSFSVDDTVWRGKEALPLLKLKQWDHGS